MTITLIHAIDYSRQRRPVLPMSERWHHYNCSPSHVFYSGAGLLWAAPSDKAPTTAGLQSSRATVWSTTAAISTEIRQSAVSSAAICCPNPAGIQFWRFSAPQLRQKMILICVFGTLKFKFKRELWSLNLFSVLILRLKTTRTHLIWA